jgi:5-formyltetrahydrofolate cyclo-ligase
MVLYQAILKGFEVKNKFRKESLKKLKNNINIRTLRKDKQICLSLLNYINKHTPKNILLYIPMDIEVNVLPIINNLRKKKNINVYVPFIVGKSFKPVKYRLPLQKGKFNIKEPKNSFLKVIIDMAIVPVVGIDGIDKRIGFGKGMYDRYYASLKHKPYTIFTQRVLCKTNKIISDKYDIKADYIITN